MTKRSLEHEEFMMNDEILRIVEEIQADASDSTTRFHKYKARYPEFAKRYPNLFESCCEPNFDIQRLRYMLNLKAAIDNKETTQEKASVEVGQRLFAQYVKPFVSEQKHKNPKN